MKTGTRAVRAIAVLPAYNAVRTLAGVLAALPSVFDEVIVSDDCSADGTYEEALRLRAVMRRRSIGYTVCRTPRNLGYGGNLKFALGTALAHGADVIAEIHPDGEYGPDGIAPALRESARGAHLVIGNRFTGGGKPDGMYTWKYVGSLVLTALCNRVMGLRIADMHQGFRVYTRTLLSSLDVRRFSNGFLFSFEIIAAAAACGLCIRSVPVTARYSGRKRGAPTGHSVRYVAGVIRTLLVFKTENKKRISGLKRYVSNSLPCRFCTSPGFLVTKTRLSGRYHKVWCESCGLGCLDPVPNDTVRHYPAAYWQRPGMAGYLQRAVFRIFQRRRIRWVMRSVRHGAKVLDVGAGRAFFGRDARSLDVVSIDAPWARVPDNTVHRVDFLTWKTRARFDAVCFWESLEHVTDPEAYLRAARRLLVPGGRVFIEYPDASSIEARLFGAAWLHLDVPRHTVFFSPGGLEWLARRAGFERDFDHPVFAGEYGPAGVALSAVPSRGLFRYVLFIPAAIAGAIMELCCLPFGQSPIRVYSGKSI